MSTPPNHRRVVTGHNESGKSVISMDGLLESQDVLEGKLRITTAWRTDATPAPDNNKDIDGATRPAPGIGLVVPNGTNNAFTDLAPGATAPMHRTTSVDYNILISGRLVLILDDGVQTEIKPGDVVVQRGTIHGWYNPSETEWARWVTVLVDADPAKANGKELTESWHP